jgi:hypothetical protein
MDIQAVSTAFATVLSPLDVRVYDYGPDAPISPAVFIYPLDIAQYEATFDGAVTANFVLRFLVASGAAKGGQAQLNGLLSPKGAGSAVALILKDNTLGGVVSGSHVAQMRNYGVLTFPDTTRYYSAELVVEVYA